MCYIYLLTVSLQNTNEEKVLNEYYFIEFPPPPPPSIDIDSFIFAVCFRQRKTMNVLNKCELTKFSAGGSCIVVLCFRHGSSATNNS